MSGPGNTSAESPAAPSGVVTGRILLVGASEASFAWERLFSAKPWQCCRCDTLTGVLPRLRNTTDVDLLLLAPDTNVKPYVEFCRNVKLDPRTAFVPVVLLLPSTFLLPMKCLTSRAEVFAAGADDCIQLPASSEEIKTRVANALRTKHATDSLEDATLVISSLANAIEGRDRYTRGHVERVSAYCVELGRRLGVGDDEAHALTIAGIVHDIGKVVIPDHILNKPEPLAEQEMALIRRHPLVGDSILQPLRTLRTVRPLVRWHHERPNGTGYPDGLRDEELPLLPRIVAVADCFDAISTDRPYRPAHPPEKWRGILTEAAAKGDLDSTVIDTLLEILGEPEFSLVATAI